MITKYNKDRDFNTMSGDEMMKFCRYNLLGTPQHHNLAGKHFDVALSLLHDNEKISAIFMGNIDKSISLISEGVYACVMTNERIILARKKIFGSNTLSVLYDNLNDISFKSRIRSTVIKIDTLGELIDIKVPVADDKYLKQLVFSAIRSNKDITSSSDQHNDTKIDPYEEVKKVKELYDLGIISKDEYETKRKDLLNL